MKKILAIAIWSVLICSCSSGGSGGDENPPPDNTNFAPTVPGLVSPKNGELCANNVLDFRWNTSSDSNGDPITYTIQISGNNQFSQIDYTATGTVTNFNFTLERGQAYYWRVKATDSRGESSNYSSVFSLFTEGDGVSNHLPFAPELIMPQMDASVDAGAISLEWSVNDVDGDVLTSDVYFGTDNPPTTLVSENQSTLSFNINTASATTYYWRIVVTDGKGGSTIGQVWNFSTN